jgi:hypothetical protein
MRIVGLTALALSTCVLACSQREEPPSRGSSEVPASDLAQRLVGSWMGQSETRGSMAFIFDADQSAMWIVHRPTAADTLHIAYVATERDGRLLIDLSGFETGPLAGLVMYGLVEFEGMDTLRIDLEPGPPGNDEPRPAALTSPDAMTLVRGERR